MRSGGDIDAGTFLVMVIALPLVGIAAAIGGRGGEIIFSELWPFLLIGAIVPGAAQLLAARAVIEIGSVANRRVARNYAARCRSHRDRGVR